MLMFHKRLYGTSYDHTSVYNKLITIFITTITIIKFILFGLKYINNTQIYKHLFDKFTRKDLPK